MSSAAGDVVGVRQRRPLGRSGLQVSPLALGCNVFGWTVDAATTFSLLDAWVDAGGNLIGCLVGGKTPGQFSVRRSENFDISDAVLLPSGDLLLLERKFSLLDGIGIRIRRIALASVVPGAVIDGPSIFNADLGSEIDNLEGIDVHVTPEGDTVLTLVSDDNFGIFEGKPTDQRTLFLAFDWAPPKPH